MSKHQKGQFFTTQSEYILQGFTYPPETKRVIEPFAGKKDLLSFLPSSVSAECYDIEPQSADIIQRDTLRFPPDYRGAFVITNPPYLARNKAEEKEIFDLYHTNDLYKCFLLQLLDHKPDGGILIIPLNFWCSVRISDIELRSRWLETFEIIQLNIFEEPVFDDTTCAVCSFQFQTRTHPSSVPLTFYPSCESLEVDLNDSNSYLVGGEIYNLPVSGRYSIRRITLSNENQRNTNLRAKCIDDKELIHLSIVEDSCVYVDQTEDQTGRTYASFVIDPPLSLSLQTSLVSEFNRWFTEYRKKYHSLFLSNYRDSRRKRISFDLLYRIMAYLIEK